MFVNLDRFSRLSAMEGKAGRYSKYVIRRLYTLDFAKDSRERIIYVSRRSIRVFGEGIGHSRSRAFNPCVRELQTLYLLSAL